MIRTDGVSSLVSQYHWRWTPTAEEILLAQAQEEPKPLPPAPAPAPAETPKEVPAAKAEEAPATHAADPKHLHPSTCTALAPLHPRHLRHRESPSGQDSADPRAIASIRNVRIDTDWSASPPTEVWRRPVGPGWSSFSVRGDLFYTQEQRGEEEIVVVLPAVHGRTGVASSRRGAVL